MPAFGLVLVIVMGVAAVGGLDLGVPWLLGWCARSGLRHRAKKRRAVVLTFDDGPGHRLTPAILDLLARRNAKATFFLLGRNVAGREALVRQIAAQGHEICSHGHTHAHLWRAGPLKAIRDITHGWDAINGVLDHLGNTYPFRPPYGKLDLVTLVYLWLKRVAVCYWTADSTDTWAASAWNPRHAADTVHRDGGGVVLAHDFDRATPEVEQIVLDAVTGVLDVAREDGLKVMTFSELIHGDRN